MTAATAIFCIAGGVVVAVVYAIYYIRREGKKYKRGGE